MEQMDVIYPHVPASSATNPTRLNFIMRPVLSPVQSVMTKHTGSVITVMTELDLDKGHISSILVK